jgi:Nucleoside-diphosphate-sugar epimerases
MRRAVVTGANGMIGASLVNDLLKNGYEVLALIRKGEKAGNNLLNHAALRMAICELEDMQGFTFEDAGYDVFFHFAWEGAFGPLRDDAALQLRNIQYTLDALGLAKRLGCKHFIGAGSQAEYGRIEHGVALSPETPVWPLSGYGIAKLAAGQLGKLRAKNLGLWFNWVRILSVYGPMEKPHSLTMSTILKLLDGEKTSFTKGEQVWDFLFCEDAASAFRLIGEKGHDGQVYVLGSGQPITLKEALITLCKAVDPEADAGLGELPYPVGQVMYLQADISKLTEETGFIPQVPYEQGILKTIKWVRENR